MYGAILTSGAHAKLGTGWCGLRKDKIMERTSRLLLGFTYGWSPEALKTPPFGAFITWLSNEFREAFGI